MHLRLARADDAEGIAGIYGKLVESTPISFETVPPTSSEILTRIQNTLPAHPWLVAESEGGVAGYAYASRHRERAAYRWSVEVSVYVAEEWRGQGLASLLYSELLTILRAQGFRRALAGITLPNPGSVALHEKFGFKAVGIYEKIGFKLGGWHDVGWWSCDLSPDSPSAVAPEPLTLPELRRISNHPLLTSAEPP